jgi:hypothetical protein
LKEEKLIHSAWKRYAVFCGGALVAAAIALPVGAAACPAPAGTRFFVPKPVDGAFT